MKWADTLNDTVDRDDHETAPATRGVIAQALGRLDRLFRRLRGAEDPAVEPSPDVAFVRPYPWETNYPED